MVFSEKNLMIFITFLQKESKYEYPVIIETNPEVRRECQNGICSTCLENTFEKLKYISYDVL